MEVIELLEREKKKLIEERSLIRKLLESPNFGRLIRQEHPRPENFVSEFSRLTTLINSYEEDITKLKNMELKNG